MLELLNIRFSFFCRTTYANAEGEAHHIFEGLKFSGQSFTLDELVDQLKGKEEKPSLLVDYLQDANDKLQRMIVKSWPL